MITRYIDAHCHLQESAFDADREVIFARMSQDGIGAIVVGDDVVSSERAVALAKQHDNCWATVGSHPHHIGSGQQTFELRQLAAQPKVVAIGECGIDYSRMDPSRSDEIKQAQKELFKEHILLAAEINKPLMVHVRAMAGSRDAYVDAIRILSEAKTDYPALNGNIHFFAGGLAEAEAIISLGFTISFTAVITFASEYDNVIRAVSLEKILAETDAPFVSPSTRRGERNDPISVIDVVNRIADIRGEDREVTRRVILENTERLFLSRN